MYESDLWKYCTAGHCREMLLSFRLLEGEEWTEEKIISCLYAVSNHTERHYTKIKIPKKDGGSRQILAPDPLLKTIQKNILRHILAGLKLSPYATAYHKGAVISDNASPHIGKSLLLKLDIRDFFGSITFPMIQQRVFSSRYFPPAVGTMLTALCCYRDYLPQGSPASAAISNLVMKPFDEYMGNWCGERRIAYSRYCDDMTFSGEFEVREVKSKVKGFLGAMGFELNPAKTKVLTRHVRQTVTGIVVNDKTSVPLPYRKKLRQEVYYCTHYGIEEHLQRKAGNDCPGSEPDEVIRYLRSLIGKIDHVLSITPDDAYFASAKRDLKVLLNQNLKILKTDRHL